MSDNADHLIGGDWFKAIERVLRASTGDLRELAQIAGADPKTLYVGTSLDGVDLRGQDLRGMILTNREGAITDEATLLDPERPARPNSGEAPSPALARKRAAACLAERLAVNLTAKKGSLFETNDGAVRAVVTTSRRYPRAYQAYWYCFYESQRDYLAGAPDAYLVLTGIDTGRAWAIPLGTLEPFLDEMKMTRRPNGQGYWHVSTKLVADACVLVVGDGLDLMPFEV
ncbi:hypothetical protein V5F59_11350 [Xanthobacter autotrophicus DSM 431]|uniref:hypothetical protein n=1 Tax=Xanthobacter nonsaccharivorans TaxID=3119912 RepID=UPI00372C1B2E